MSKNVISTCMASGALVFASLAVAQTTTPGDAARTMVAASPNTAPSDRLSLAEVIEAVIRAHPDVRVAQERYLALSQRPAQEASLPDPMITTGYTSAGNPLPGAGLGSEPNASIAIMVSQEIPYPGKRQARAEVARREADAERQLVDTARLSLAAKTKQAYYRLAAAYQLDDVLSRNETLLADLLKVSESRYSVGQAAQQDVIRTQKELSLLALQRRRIALERRTREGELNALMARAPEAPVGRPEDLAPIGFTQTLPQLIDAAQAHSPMLRRDRLMIATADAGIDVVQREFKPDFAVSGGYGFAGSMPDMYEFRFDVVIPLRKARRKAMLAEQQHTAAAARQTLEGSKLSLQNRLQEDFQMASTAAELAMLYRETVLPQARLALESSISSYQTGTVDFLSVLTNFGSVLEYEMSYVEQLADLYAAASRLEEMAAVPVLQ
jgi:outer membrane protein TolC